MRSILGAVQLTSATFVMFVAMSAIVVALVAPSVLRRARSLAPAVAVRRLRWLVAGPLLGGALLSMAAFSPSFAASVVDAHHHCDAHEGHPHLCVVHLPGDAGSAALWLVLAASCVVVAVRLAPLVRGLRVARRLVSNLELEPTSHSAGTIVLPTSEPFCAAVGWAAPSIVVSRGFLRGMTSAHVEVAVAHESAHARRRDAWWTFAARASATLLPRAVAGPILAELDLATERACDEEAALATGDRIEVAEAILAGERLALRRVELLGASFGSTGTDVRIRALLADEPPPPRGVSRWDLRAACVVVLVFASGGFLHHAAETIVGLAAH